MRFMKKKRAKRKKEKRSKNLKKRKKRKRFLPGKLLRRGERANMVAL